ncbi:hypothetical protein [Halalkalibacter oceani]|uniref:RNA polymerase subunit sigma n=1 Tax=Halalkalibacter oceani TaxID=1653776 RepID=A0A9X2DNH8_9BACI|nr:hypothetical protein [Halalkalibacter oceani]MCM3713220.1 hypothetical protein [Halalkalibacter oceani]
MSVRPIEVQGSIPQSQKIGKLQDQLQQRGQVSQELLTQQQKEEDLQKRRQVNETNDSEQARFHHDGEAGQHEQESQQQSKKQEEKQPEAKHPYKGKFIDFSG